MPKKSLPFAPNVSYQNCCITDYAFTAHIIDIAKIHKKLELHINTYTKRIKQSTDWQSQVCSGLIPPTG